MGILQEIESVSESITNTQTPEASALSLIDFFIAVIGDISKAANPAQAAEHAATTVAANKAQLATAVAANP